jgi:hypothetical protein
MGARRKSENEGMGRVIDGTTVLMLLLAELVLVGAREES